LSIGLVVRVEHSVRRVCVSPLLHDRVNSEIRMLLDWLHLKCALSSIIRPHRYAKHKMQPIVTVVAWSVCVGDEREPCTDV